MTAENELAKLAWRCIDEAERVISNIEPENDTEAAKLWELSDRMCRVSKMIFAKAYTGDEVEGWFYGNLK